MKNKSTDIPKIEETTANVSDSKCKSALSQSKFQELTEKVHASSKLFEREPGRRQKPNRLPPASVQSGKPPTRNQRVIDSVAEYEGIFG